MVANEITEHKATPEYQEQARKSGTEKNKSGLTEMELSMKEERKRAARMRYGHHPFFKGGDMGFGAPPHPLNFAIWRVHVPPGT